MCVCYSLLDYVYMVYSRYVDAKLIYMSPFVGSFEAEGNLCLDFFYVVDVLPVHFFTESSRHVCV